MCLYYREQIEVCVDILERILIALSPVTLVQNYRAELQAGLTHPNDTVKILALTQVGFTHQHPHTESQTTDFISLPIIDWQDCGAPRCCR